MYIAQVQNVHHLVHTITMQFGEDVSRRDAIALEENTLQR